MGVYVCVRGYGEEYAGRKYWNCTGTEGLQNKTYKINPTLVVIGNPEHHYVSILGTVTYPCVTSAECVTVGLMTGD
ncbi:hypothetical protein EYF80_015605 [Liparis tanakae]|uniref:Uncharacterized protein n=1 Tax=Liparis tanakae TaxID=230148 RepID=A0A4Z2I8G4_9TELE|nr:hypothetical protein EYF80_015605 [Liparis tanakae]